MMNKVDIPPLPPAAEERFLQANARLKEMQRRHAMSSNQIFPGSATKGLPDPTPRVFRDGGLKNAAGPLPSEHKGYSRDSHGKPTGYSLESHGETQSVGFAHALSERVPGESWSLTFPGTEADLSEAVNRCTIPGGTLEGLLEEAIQINEKSQDETETPCSVWRFASRLKSYRPFSGWKASRIVNWLDENLPAVGGWERLPDWNGFGAEDLPREAFIRIWPRVKKPFPWLPPPEIVLPLAESHVLESESWASERDATFRRMVSLCFWYDRIMQNCGHQNFFLSCRKAGELLRIGHVQAWNLLSRAVDDGIVILEKKGEMRSGNPGDASEFSFDFERVKIRYLAVVTR